VAKCTVVPNLEVAYFDQHRADLDTERTVMDNLAEGKQA
jgi:ATP-binding cassette subfamily F protein uup